MKHDIDIPAVRVALSGLLIVLAVILSRVQRLSLEKELVIGAVRAAVQLIAVGFALTLLLGTTHPVWILATMAVMLTVGSWTAASRIHRGPGVMALMPATAVAIFVGLVVSLVPVLLWVLPVRPFFRARFAVPLAGILMAVGMNSASLVLERLFSSVRQERATVEQALALGASPSQAVAGQRRRAVRAAMIPRMNTLLTLGLVQLPGLMTGQILSGTPPVQAVKYQLVLMYQLIAMATISATLAASFGVRVMFESGERLKQWDKHLK